MVSELFIRSCVYFTVLLSYRLAMRMFSDGIADEFPPHVGSDGLTVQSARTISEPTQSCDSVRHQGCTRSSKGLSAKLIKIHAKAQTTREYLTL